MSEVHESTSLIEVLREELGLGGDAESLAMTVGEWLADESVGYALQAQVNLGRPSAYWQMDAETEIRDALVESADVDGGWDRG